MAALRRGLACLACAGAVWLVPAGAQAAGLEPHDITPGPDGALWFTESGGIGRITTGGQITEFALGRDPASITSGPDGALWFTLPDHDLIGRITAAGTVTEFPVPGAGSRPLDIVAGPDGRLWFTEAGSNEIAAITTAGAVTEFPVPTPDAVPAAITATATRLFFTELIAGKVGRATTAGAIDAEFPLASGANDIAEAADGHLYVTQTGSGRMARMHPDGAFQEVQLFGLASAPTSVTRGPDGAAWVTKYGIDEIIRMSGTSVTDTFVLDGAPHGIAPGPDGALWFTLPDSDRIGRLTTAGTDTYFALRPPPPPAPADPPPPPPPPPAAEPAAAAAPAAGPATELGALRLYPSRPRAGRRLRVRYTLTRGADLALSVRRGAGAARVVAERSAAPAGPGTLLWNGRLSGRRAGAGRYTLTIAATRDGRTVTRSRTVRLRPALRPRLLEVTG